MNVCRQGALLLSNARIMESYCVLTLEIAVQTMPRFLICCRLSRWDVASENGTEGTTGLEDDVDACRSENECGSNV